MIQGRQGVGAIDPKLCRLGVDVNRLVKIIQCFSSLTQPHQGVASVVEIARFVGVVLYQLMLQRQGRFIVALLVLEHAQMVLADGVMSIYRQDLGVKKTGLLDLPLSVQHQGLFEVLAQ